MAVSLKGQGMTVDKEAELLAQRERKKATSVAVPVEYRSGRDERIGGKEVANTLCPH